MMDDRDLEFLLDRIGPWILLSLVSAFMFWIRMVPSDRVITEADVLFSGNDPWYHARMVQYTVRYFPATPNFDAWSYFPYGTARHSGFGGLFDQLIASSALLLGLGNPSARFVEVVTAIAPAVFGAITVVIVYLIATQLMDRWSALISAGLLALLKGQFLSRTIVGVSDHQSAEPFFGALAILGFMYVVKTSYSEKPTVTAITEKNYFSPQRSLLAGLLGGTAIATYLMLWGPGVFLILTMGVFVVFQLNRDHIEGHSLESLTFATVISFVTAAIITFAYAKTYALSPTVFSLLQPLVLSGIAFGALILWFLSERFRAEGHNELIYPPTVFLLCIGTIVIGAIIHPRVLELGKGLIVRIYSFGLLTSPSAQTVAEISPATLSNAWNAYSTLFPIAIFGFFILVHRVVKENRPIELLLILCSLTITSAYFTMIRFGYYFAVIIAILAGFAIWWTITLVELNQIRMVNDSEPIQLVVVGIIIIAVLPGNIVPLNGANQPVWDLADRVGGANTAWQNELRWVEENTPKIPLNYYGQFERPEGVDFDYPDEAYGVMSWWDYGHWITYTGKRIPNANPFQEGPRIASAFLLAKSETKANLILEALPSARKDGGELEDLSNRQLRSIIAQQTEEEAKEDTRYIIIDDEMVAYSTGKFQAIATWSGPRPSAYTEAQQFELKRFTESGSETVMTRTVTGLNYRYEDTILSRLYFDDGKGLAHYRLIHETNATTTFVSIARRTKAGFESIGINMEATNLLFTALKHARQQRHHLLAYDIRRASRVKTFERVEGATITGDAGNVSSETQVIAELSLRTNTGRKFSYIRQTATNDEGEFQLTVSYPTDDKIGTAARGTNSGIVAMTNYSITIGNSSKTIARRSIAISEAAVYNGSQVVVNLDRGETE